MTTPTPAFAPTVSLGQVLAAVPDAVHAMIGPCLAPAGELPGVCRAFFADVGDDAVAVFAVFDHALVRAEAVRAGATRTTTLPLSQLRRLDELADGARLTVVLELDADTETLSLIGAQIGGRYELQGTVIRNGYVLVAEGPRRAQLGAFRGRRRCGRTRWAWAHSPGSRCPANGVGVVEVIGVVGCPGTMVDDQTTCFSPPVHCSRYVPCRVEWHFPSGGHGPVDDVGESGPSGP